LGIGEPASYRILVQGHLDERTVTHMGDARVEAGNPQVTQLLVRILDQAGLSGVLDTLYGLHLPILSVQLVSDEEEITS
jgi:hypothetical protein